MNPLFLMNRRPNAFLPPSQTLHQMQQASYLNNPLLAHANSTAPPPATTSVTKFLLHSFARITEGALYGVLALIEETHPRFKLLVSALRSRIPSTSNRIWGA